MRFIHLSSDESAQLEKVYATSTNVVARRRSQCLLLSAQGHAIQHLTRIFSVCRITIYHWFDGWQTHGQTGFRHQPGKGRKRKLAPLAPAVVEDLVKDTRRT